MNVGDWKWIDLSGLWSQSRTASLGPRERRMGSSCHYLDVGEVMIKGNAQDLKNNLLFKN